MACPSCDRRQRDLDLVLARNDALFAEAQRLGEALAAAEAELAQWRCMAGCRQPDVRPGDAAPAPAQDGPA